MGRARSLGLDPFYKSPGATGNDSLYCTCCLGEMNPTNIVLMPVFSPHKKQAVSALRAFSPSAGRLRNSARSRLLLGCQAASVWGERAGTGRDPALRKPSRAEPRPTHLKLLLGQVLSCQDEDPRVLTLVRPCTTHPGSWTWDPQNCHRTI